MKSLLLLPLILLSTTATAAEVAVSAAGGVVVMDQLETLGTTWTVNGRVDYFFQEPLGIELETGFLSGRTVIGDYPYVALTPRVNLIGRLWTQGPRQEDGKLGKPPPVRPLLVAGVGGFYKGTNDQETDADGNPVTDIDGNPVYALGPTYKRQDIDFMVNAGPGLMVPLGNTLHLRTDLRWLVNLGTESFRQRGDRFIDWEWNIGLGLTFGGPKDSDKDGILDADDTCPEEPEDMDGFEDADGCPDNDNDGDGVADTDEGKLEDGTSCMNLAEDLDEFEDSDGCPDPDNDGDGVADGDDVCPTKAGSKAAKGCPDQDEDGIVDEEDECMDEKGPRASFGCPDEDKDMVPDYRDQCPTEPASKGADPMRSDGCPKKVYITKDAIKILDKVFFDTGKATIKPASHALLDEIAKSLEDNTNIKKVQIEGHTDNVGDPAKNKVLSEDRAKSVMAYLTGKGIAAERLTAVGFGQEKPLVDGEAANTKEGREQNRRVEFNITEQEAVTVTFTREALTTEDHQVELKGDLKVVKAVVPQMRTVMGEPVCDAILTIGEDGMVKQVVVNGCVAMPRSVTRRTLEKWQFEPMKDSEGKPQSVTVELKMAFKAGRGTPEIDEKSIKPVE